MMKKYFALILVLLMLLSACSREVSEIEFSHPADESVENEIAIPQPDPIIYSADDILEDDTTKTVRDYYSITMDYIREIIPQNPDAENSEDGYIGDNVITHCSIYKEILRKPVYVMGEPAQVDDVSLARVQWLDGENAMIDGRLVYNTETGKQYEFNASWENVLNYALNKDKDKLAVSFVDEGKYRLSLYDFKTEQWEILFEEESDRIYYFGAKLAWKGKDELVFSAGIKKENSAVSPEEELDIYIINMETRKCRRLAEKAYLMCNTGSFVGDRIFYSKDSVEELSVEDSEIWVYDFKTESSSRINESRIKNQFWLPQKGLLGFYAKAEKCIKLYCDSKYALLGKIDLSSVVSGDDVVEVNAGADYIRFSVYERENEISKRYKVNISDIRERNYYFIDDLYLGFTECGEFYNRTQSENVYGEFLSQEGYDVYSQEGYLLRSTEVKFDIVPGHDNFFEEKYAELLEKTASEVSEDQQTRVFKLPVAMSEEVYNVPHNDYNGYIDFVGVGNVLTNNELRLVTNAKHDLLPRKVEKTTANEKDTENIRKELEKDGITKAPINVTEVMVCDLDGDGTNERIVFANSSDDKFVGDADSGNYTMAFVARESGIEYFRKETSRYGAKIPDLETRDNYFDHWVSYSSCAGIYDLNGDGKFEICVELGMYEHGRYMVFSENEDGKYSLVLYSECGT